jgi:hypothetical protein
MRIATAAAISSLYNNNNNQQQQRVSVCVKYLFFNCRWVWLVSFWLPWRLAHCSGRGVVWIVDSKNSFYLGYLLNSVNNLLDTCNFLTITERRDFVSLKLAFRDFEKGKLELSIETIERFL